MRLLILSATVLAFASAAPSIGYPTPPVLVPGAFVFPAAVATISSGDIQAALIDAKVQAEDQVRLIQDQARAAADQARLIAGQTRFLAEQSKEQPQLKVKETSEVSGASILPAGVTTISPGDIQAEFIDAEVRVENHIHLIQDQARAAAGQARLIADQIRFLAEQSKEQSQLKVKETSEVSGASILPAGVATISPGDIQAAFIDAEVRAENLIHLIQDQARAAADQARLITDQTRFLAEKSKEQPQLKVKETSEVSGASVLPAGVTTISPGDIQAAFIDAKVQAEDHIHLIQDQARAAAGQARLIADQIRFLAEQSKEQPQLKVKETSEVSGASVLPAGVATISPGDSQAAFIDAEVRAENLIHLIQDQARATAGQARLIAEQIRFLAEQSKEQRQLKVKETSEVSGASALPAGVVTISPGDIQAAFIDAKVQAENHVRLIEDQARAAADQARLIADKTRFLAEQSKEQPQLKVKATSEVSGAFVLPAGVATISPGDIQAAFIDAKVQAENHIRLIEDQARAAADQTRLIADQTRFFAEQDTKQPQLKGKETNEISGAFVLPAAVATISPGDIQAAFIDVKVQAEDQARLIADQTRFLTEQAKERARLEIEKINGINQQTDEKALEAFLFLEEQKRQVVEAWKAVEAQVNEAIAKDPSILVKQTGSNTFVSPMITIDAVLSPFPSRPVVKSTTAETEIPPVDIGTFAEKTEVTAKTASVTDESKVQEAIGANTESLTKCNQSQNASPEKVSEAQQIAPGSTHT